MYAKGLLPKRWRAWGVLVAGVAVVLAFAVGCGSDTGIGSGEGAGSRNVIPSDRIYTIDDLLAVGFRNSKQYDVEGLPAALDARFGFWGRDPYKRMDYEVRFYASHEDAVEFGSDPADQITGTDDLVANSDTLVWREGWKEWWFRAAAIMTFSDVMSKHNVAKYNDFVILGNMVMLCEGQDAGQSLERCEDFMDAIHDAEGS